MSRVLSFSSFFGARWLPALWICGALLLILGATLASLSHAAAHAASAGAPLARAALTTP